MPADPAHRYASRGGLKLAAALDEFGIDVGDLKCADFGCSTGGFTDCLLKRGARSVIAIDTGYGVLDYRLRTDDRVEVRERTNALHDDPPEGGVDLVVADMSWTPQRRVVPQALRWLREGGLLITLIKPHYEVKGTPEKDALNRGVLAEDAAERVAGRVAAEICAARLTKSPILGGKKKSRGNIEYLALVRPGRSGG
jgi:23S rRNA (cytidine1920-2'-O)/16S rRNA (cytidine1409-2'-O)-methyltransferase